MLGEMDKTTLAGLRSKAEARRTTREKLLVIALEHLEGCELCCGSGDACGVGAGLLGAVGEEPDPVCCTLKRKIILGVMGVVPENVCGIPDSEVADVMVFDITSPNGHSVIGLRFCPWCGDELVKHTTLTDPVPKPGPDGP